jgi:microcystin-dependent protein
MATILKFRRYTTAALASVTGAIGELIVDTDKDTITVHDGSTAGGKPLATETYTDTALSTALGDYYTSIATDSAITTALSSYYTSTATDSAITTALSSYYTSTATDSAISTALGDYYTSVDTDSAITTALSSYYTSTATDSAITTALGDYAPLESPSFTGTPSAPTPVTTDDSTTVATTEFTQALMQAMLPQGVITMWSGSILSIPTGWVLCDGTNGTPDLRNRFIVGAGDDYTVGDNGGEASSTLTTAELPGHTHTGTTDADGAHSHFVANGDTVNATTSPLSSSTTIGKNGSQASTSFNYLLGGTATTANQGLTDEEAAHSHTFTTASTGDGSSFENRPPYFALAYIMKTYA